MRVCFISTYPPTECGIATYTQYLSDAVKELQKEIVVVSQEGAQGENVFPTYTPMDNDISMKLFHVASKLTPDVINIQHEYGLFGSDSGIQILDFIIRCRLANIPTVTTLHTVYEELTRDQAIILESLIRNCSGIIVHEDYQKETLTRYFPDFAEKYHVLPHGVRQVTPHPKAKELLGIEGKKVLLLAGYFRPSKGFHRIVKVFPEIAKQVEDVVLVVAGKIRGLEFADYQNEFFDMINTSEAFDKIVVLRGQFPQYTFDTIMSAGDVLAMPYEVGAQSGIMAQASAFNLPLITSPIPSFKRWNEEIQGGITCHNDKDYIDAAVKILGDDDYRMQLRQNIETNIAARKWLPIGAEHIKIFEKYIHVPYGRGRYFYVPEGT